MFAFRAQWAPKIKISTEHHLDGCPCWDWTGWNTGHGTGRGRGYGKVRVNGKGAMAHRAVYEAMVRTIQPGMELDHLCKRRNCVNPRHVEEVTRFENVMRSSAALYRTKDGYEPALNTIEISDEIPF